MDPHDTPFGLLAQHHPVVVSFGGGLNSTALLVKWVLDANPPPHLILFADTGCERPDVYAHIERFSSWLVSHDMPAIQVVKKGGRAETLEQYALRTKHLPSLAYGRKSCSHKFKIEPQDRTVNRWPPARKAWADGRRVVKLIGYGAEEQKRISKARIEDDKYVYRFPLDEWGVDRAGCVRLCERAGVPVPGKSSCFFCPASKKQEIATLARVYPDLAVRAVHLETTARAAGNMRTTKGLGRQFAWGDFLAGADVPEAPAASCMYCVDEARDFDYAALVAAELAKI